MKCFEITINGERVCTAGVGDDGVLTSVVALVKRKGASPETADVQTNGSSESLDLRVAGLANRETGVTQQLEWVNRDLDIGDEVVIRNIQASICDEPDSKKLSYVECSFCGKKQAEVAKLIAGPAVFICKVCVGDCVDALAHAEPTGVITIVIGKTAEYSCSALEKHWRRVLPGMTCHPRKKVSTRNDHDRKRSTQYHHNTWSAKSTH